MKRSSMSLAVLAVLAVGMPGVASQTPKPARPVPPPQTVQPVSPAQDVKDSLGMTKAMRERLNAVNKNKSANVKSLRDAQNTAIEDLRSKVDANAADADIAAVFSGIKAGMKSIRDAEIGYWDSLAVFLTPTQIAKIFLRSHPPKNSTAAPAPAAKPQPAPQATPPAMSEKDWKAYTALTKDQEDKLNAANKERGTNLASLKNTRDNDIENLRSRVNANASDADVQAAFSSVKSDLAAIMDADDGRWDTVAAFLSPLQTAKLFLKGHPKKN